MDILKIVLAFFLIRHLMNMAFPKRGKKATECDILLIGSLPLSKAFKAIAAYYKRNKPQ